MGSYPQHITEYNLFFILPNKKETNYNKNKISIINKKFSYLLCILQF